MLGEQSVIVLSEHGGRTHRETTQFWSVYISKRTRNVKG